MAKGRKQKARLAARQDDWEKMKYTSKSEKKLKQNKSEFTKPGSLRK